MTVSPLGEQFTDNNKKGKKMLNGVRLLAVSAFFLGLTFATCEISHAQGQDSCDRGAKTFKLKIKQQDNKPTKVTKGLFGRRADTVNVCRGDTIEWRLSGKRFYIAFPGAAPFATNKKQSEDGRVAWTISADARRGDSYKYDIGIVDGGVLDPIIIVD